jgi:hypothetical protein
MADTKLSALTELAAAPASGDEVYIRDISETAADESKKITILNLQKLVANLDLNGFNIAFPSTQVTDAGGNVLDDYEESTFTPGISDNSTNATSDSQTYTSMRNGFYTKIGDQCIFQLRVLCDDLGDLNLNETTRVVDLPFPSLATTNSVAHVSVGNAGSLNITASESVAGAIDINSTFIRMAVWNTGTGLDNLLISEFSAGANLGISGSYKVA